MKRRPKGKESQILRDCLLCLAHQRYVVVGPGEAGLTHITNLSKGILWRNNTGAARFGKHFYRFGIPGAPDIIGFDACGRFMGIETKTEKGELTPEQTMFRHWLKRAGGIYIVARSYEDLEISLKHLELTGGTNE